MKPRRRAKKQERASELQEETKKQEQGERERGKEKEGGGRIEEKESRGEGDRNDTANALLRRSPLSDTRERQRKGEEGNEGRHEKEGERKSKRGQEKPSVATGKTKNGGYQKRLKQEDRIQKKVSFYCDEQAKTLLTRGEERDHQKNGKLEGEQVGTKRSEGKEAKDGGESGEIVVCEIGTKKERANLKEIEQGMGISTSKSGEGETKDEGLMEKDAEIHGDSHTITPSSATDANSPLPMNDDEKERNEMVFGNKERSESIVGRGGTCESVVGKEEGVVGKEERGEHGMEREGEDQGVGATSSLPPNNGDAIVLTFSFAPEFDPASVSAASQSNMLVQRVGRDRIRTHSNDR